MKNKVVFILAIQFIIIVSCKTTNKPIKKTINYEELALKYFINSVYLDETNNLKDKHLFYDGLVSGTLTYDKYSIYSYPEQVEFIKSSFQNKAKDFYIKFPKQIKGISFVNFNKNKKNYFIYVSHYNKSKRKVLVTIQLLNKKEVTNTIFITMDLEGKLLNHSNETLMYVAPPK